MRDDHPFLEAMKDVAERLRARGTPAGDNILRRVTAMQDELESWGSSPPPPARRAEVLSSALSLSRDANEYLAGGKA
jgi:hypothetical protein